MVWFPVLAPLGGRVVALSDVPDEVFADGLLGPGIAIEPARPSAPTPSSCAQPEAESQDLGRNPSVIAFAPISGRIAKLFPHAYAITRAHITVLVHLGLDTVQLRGEGFHLLVAEGDEVAAGDPITEWNLAAMRAAERNCIVPVVSLGTTPNCLAQLHEPGSLIRAGEPLFNLEE